VKVYRQSRNPFVILANLNMNRSRTEDDVEVSLWILLIFRPKFSTFLLRIWSVLSCPDWHGAEGLQDAKFISYELQ
jgi:hypothetical protein